VTPVLMLVGGNADAVRKAQSLGQQVVLIQHRDKLALGGHDLAEVTVVADYTDWSVLRPLAITLREVYGVTAVTSLTEAGVENAARLNDLFGFGGTSHEVISRMRDKATMRAHLDAVGASTIAHAVVTDADSMRAFGAAHGYPFIVKPTNATASFGVRRVDGPDGIDEAYAQVNAMRGEKTDRGSTLFTVREFLMEQYVDGPEFSVEAFSFAGRHVIVSVTEKMLGDGHCAELGHTVPARIPAATRAEIATAVRVFLDAIGLTDGATHTEVRLGAHGPAIIETHNRVGGDYINELVASAYGVDLITYGVAWPMRLIEELPDEVRAVGGACVRFLHSEVAGTVTGVSGVDEVRQLPEVLTATISAKPGDEVRPLRDNWDRLGMVAVSGTDAPSAVARCEAIIRDDITITVDSDALVGAA